MIKYLFLCLLLSAHAFGEIQKLSITWTAALCKDTCVKSLAEQFFRVNGVADIAINQGAGQADIRWKPNVQLTYNALRLPLAGIGLFPQTIRVRVRGMVRHDARTIWLISNGDGTKFILLGPVRALQGRFIETNSIFSHLPSVEMREEFLRAEDTHQVVEIEGVLFEPYRTSELYVIVEERVFVNPEPQ